MTRCLFIQIHATPKPAEPNVTQARKCHCGIHQKTPGPNPSSSRMLLGKMLFSCLFFLARTQNPDLVFARATVRKEMKKKQLPVGCARFFFSLLKSSTSACRPKGKRKNPGLLEFSRDGKKERKGKQITDRGSARFARLEDNCRWCLQCVQRLLDCHGCRVVIQICIRARRAFLWGNHRLLATCVGRVLFAGCFDIDDCLCGIGARYLLGVLGSVFVVRLSDLLGGTADVADTPEPDGLRGEDSGLEDHATASLVGCTWA